MNYIIAKSGREYYKVLSQRNRILESFDTTQVDQVTFSANYQLDENEWFKIEDFSNQPFFIDQCKLSFNTSSLNQISNTEFDKIKTLCIIQNGEIMFQRVYPGLFVRRKKFIDASGTPKVVEHRRHLEIAKEPDAFYKPSNDTLCFKNLSKVKGIFPGIEELNREATQQEVNAFLGNSFIDLNGYDQNRVGSSNRKRIADIGLKYSGLSQQKRDALLEYARHNSGISLNQQGDFIIDTEEKLRKFLFALDQRYYRADIYEENRLANSVIVV